RSVRAHHRASHHLENAAPNPPSDMARYNPGFVHTALACIARGRTRAAVSNDTTLAAMPPFKMNGLGREHKRPLGSGIAAAARAQYRSWPPAATLFRRWSAHPAAAAAAERARLAAVQAAPAERTATGSR